MQGAGANFRQIAKWIVGKENLVLHQQTPARRMVR
jgi:hypothetical protein